MGTPQPPRTAPLVRYRRGPGLVHLLAQVKTDQGWMVRLAWIQIYPEDPSAWKLNVIEAPVGDVERVEHEHYDAVPREERVTPPEGPPPREQSWRKKR